MTKTMQRDILLGSLKEGNKDIEILGYVTFWSMRNINVTQEQFSKMLADCGLPTRFAKAHNYRSAFTRALRNLEEKRIIRRVNEDPFKLVFQFTAENKVEEGKEQRLEYDQETIVELDKRIYRASANFEAALTKGREDIKKKVVEHFYREKVQYTSSDMTRYIQNILGEKGDLVSLRENGSIYFVPAAYQDLMDRVITLVRAFGGGSSMDFIPVPNVASSRVMVKNAFVDEIETMLNRMEKEVEEVEKGNRPVGEKWGDGKISKIQNILERISKYSTVLAEQDTKRLQDGFSALEKRIAPARKLRLEEATA